MNVPTITDKKTAILDTAEKLFAQYGFDATSTREIAEKAGANVVMISYYFGSKENLLYAIIERFSVEIRYVVSSANRKDLDPQSRLASMIDSYLEFSMSHPDPIIIAHREMGVHMRPAMQDTIQATYAEVRDTVSGIIKEGQQAGIYREIDIPLLIQGVGSMVDNMIIELHAFKRMDISLSDFGLMDINEPESAKKLKSFITEVVERFLKKDN